MLNYIEKKCLLTCFDKIKNNPKPYYDAIHLTVVGAGVAGILFTRFVFEIAKRENVKVKMTLINNVSCNYCAGLMTNIAYDALVNQSKYTIGDNVVLSRLTDCVFINSRGSDIVPLDKPLISVLRTNKFGIQGFDDYLKREILSGYEEFKDSFELIEPATLTDFDHIPEERKYNIYYNIKGMPSILKTDAVVFATGLQKIHSKLMDKMKEKLGYKLPHLMDSSVTEIDLSLAKYNNMHNKVFIIDEIIPNTVIGLVSKREDWLTVSSLNRVLTIPDLEKLFKHPSVKEYIDLENVKSALKCGIVCPTNVFVKEAQNFYGNGWVAIGDLTGMGRVLKDGYFHAAKQAYYAAWTIMYKGALKKSFDGFYYKNLEQQLPDNRTGMMLFALNRFLKNNLFFSKLFVKIIKSEKNKNPTKRYFSTAIKGLITGEISYKTVFVLFAAGIMSYLFGRK